MYNPAIHHRRSIRLKNYDYASEGLYFITLCTSDRNSIFGEIIDGVMHHNKFGEIAGEEWESTAEIRPNISLGSFIMMPNHMHGIISIDYKIKETKREDIGKFQSPSQTIGAIIRGYKGATTKKINSLIRDLKGESPIKDDTGALQFAPKEFALIKRLSLKGSGSIWQRDYFERIINSEQAYLISLLTLLTILKIGKKINLYRKQIIMMNEIKTKFNFFITFSYITP